MSIPPTIALFWAQFELSHGAEASSRFYEAFHFDDNERSANELVELVLAGKKRATASLLWSFEQSGQGPPKAGDLSVVTDWNGIPLCVIETISTSVVAFDEVSAEFAAAEGEGDGSLDYWRRVHSEYFQRECARIGREPVAPLPVVCEHFELVYRG
jgi:uncharacterized protein YhfF